MQFYGRSLVKLFSTRIPFSTKAKFNYKVLKSVVENLAFYKQSVSFIVVYSKIDGAVGGGGRSNGRCRTFDIFGDGSFLNL